MFSEPVATPIAVNDVAVVPVFAFISPVTVTDDATKSPSRLTLNGALPEFA